MALNSGDVISYMQLCLEEDASLQRGMNYKLHGKHSVILMSTRPGAPYNDSTYDEGKTIVYEGHDTPRNSTKYDPKKIDQPFEINGNLTQNGKFFNAANSGQKEIVRVYEKIKPGIWVFNGNFILTKANIESDGCRNVFKFKLEMIDTSGLNNGINNTSEPETTRVIPSKVKREVWKRDEGRCTICKSTENLHFDHIIPYTRGGSSLTSENIQILCARHNLEKSDKIQ